MEEKNYIQIKLILNKTKTILNKLIRTIDQFGINFTFKFKGEDNYSTKCSLFFFLVFISFSTAIFIINSIPFILHQNFNLLYYTINLAYTEPIKLKESPTAFAIGLDCPIDIKSNIKAEDLFDLQLYFITYTKDNEGNRTKTPELIKTHPCDKRDFYNLHNDSFDFINIKNLQCLDDVQIENHKIEGIYTDQKFTYYEFTLLSKEDTEEHFKKINDYLIENDCKLQFYYTDISVNLTNYKEPITSYINSLFLQINPTLFLKMNVFFMNYHLQNESRLLDVTKHDGEPLLKTGFSRAEQYFLYEGLNRFLTKPYNYKNYAKLYIRVDNKKLEIKRKYQQLIEFYGEQSSTLIGIFVILNILFSFINNFAFNHLIIHKLFFFEDLIHIKSINLKKSKDSRKIMNNSCPSSNRMNSISKNNDISPYYSQLSSSTKDKLPKLKKTKKKFSMNLYQAIIIFPLLRFFGKKFKPNSNEDFYRKCNDILDEKLDIFLFVRNMILLQIMYQNYLDDDEKAYINFFSRSISYLYKKEEKEEEGKRQFYKPAYKLEREDLYKRLKEFSKAKGNKMFSN